MKIYIYKDNEVSQFPPFTERLWIPESSNVIEVNNPDEADYIICPAALHRIKSKDQKLRIDKTLAFGVETLKYWKKYEHKHVFFDCSDFEVCLGGTSATLIRCNVRDFMLVDKNTIPWFWPVEDLGKYSAIPNDGIKYDVVFQGWLSTKTRRNAVASCSTVFGNKFNHKATRTFYGSMSEQERNALREEFLLGQQRAKILLAPQSIPGVFPYRFYEAMSTGRVPALFCTGYHLPFQDKIDWDKCTLRYDAESAPRAGHLIKSFLDSTSEERIIEMGKYGRQMWFEWLNRDIQPKLIAYVLEQGLKK
ncbi:MAG: exostosin domain-containing protein [Candidatus Hodarchaeales archaeon]|jgi:hypothetical protein